MNDKLQDRRDPGFFMIDYEIIDIYGAQLGVYGIAVYNVISRYANRNGENAFPSHQTIADKIGASKRKVAECIETMIELGILTKQQRKTETGALTSNTYTLLPIKNTTPIAPHAQPLLHNVHGAIAPHATDQDPIIKIPIEQDNHPQIAVTATTQTVSQKTKPAPNADDDLMPGSFLRSQLEQAGFVYLDSNFTTAATRIEADYSTEEIIRAVIAARDAHIKKIGEGGKGITSPVAYIGTILRGVIDDIGPKPKPQMNYDSPMKRMKIFNWEAAA